mmetsp:Transcript_28392/g.81533  ORF Transcript_28392/g.81533 Transcript_28392/m.81533 type:complete len:356 (-) Transcript_28392:57-1124(-)
MPGCKEVTELMNSSLSQLVQKGLKKSASRGTPWRSIKTLSALRSPCLRPCSFWNRTLRRATCCTTSDLKSAACSQVPELRWLGQAAVLCRQPAGCERSYIRTRSPTVQHPSKYWKTVISYCEKFWKKGDAAWQRKAAIGKTACSSATRPGASRRSRSASRASLWCSAWGRTHFARRPPCATMKTWFMPRHRMRFAPVASARPNTLNRPSLPSMCCSSPGTCSSSALLTLCGSACSVMTGQACRCECSTTGRQHEQGGSSPTTCADMSKCMLLMLLAEGEWLRPAGLATGEPPSSAGIPNRLAPIVPSGICSWQPTIGGKASGSMVGPNESIPALLAQLLGNPELWPPVAAGPSML